MIVDGGSLDWSLRFHMVFGGLLLVVLMIINGGFLKWSGPVFRWKWSPIFSDGLLATIEMCDAELASKADMVLKPRLGRPFVDEQLDKPVVLKR